MSYQLLGFDLDGVIIDSLACMRRSWDDARQKLSIKASFEDYSGFIGMPFPAIVSELEIPESKASVLQQLYFQNTKKYESLVKPFGEVVNTIIDYSSPTMGSPVCIITSKPRSRAVPLLKKIGLGYVTLICPEDTGRGKPFPDPLLKANHIFGVRPDASLYIGDMHSDWLAASRAGWNYAHATWGYGNNNLFDESQKVHILDTPLELKKIILS